jgi:hypothetical protein
LPEIWIPYGETETLVTLQAENLQDVAECKEEVKINLDSMELPEKPRIYVLDTFAPTLDALSILSERIIGLNGALFSSKPERVWSSIPVLKERTFQKEFIAKVNEKGEVIFIKDNTDSDVFISTILPDPIFGILEPRVNLVTELFEGSWKFLLQKKLDLPQIPITQTGYYRDVFEMAQKVRGKFIGVIPCSGKALKVLEQMDEQSITLSMQVMRLQQSRGMLVGAGGKGYDDSLSQSVRHVWNAVSCLKERGTLVVIAECSEGLGSKAMEMYVTGRMKTENLDRGRYVQGIESVILLTELKKRFDVMLLSGLPDVYVKKRLGLTPLSSSKEAVNRLIGKMQRSGKINVVIRAAETYIAPAQ